MSTPTPMPGLCEDCRWHRVVASGRGARFWLCRRSAFDDRFPRYPRLPVLACIGYQRGAPDEPHDSHEPHDPHEEDSA